MTIRDAVGVAAVLIVDLEINPQIRRDGPSLGDRLPDEIRSRNRPAFDEKEEPEVGAAAESDDQQADEDQIADAAAS
jgi:hypothetical protein